MDTQRRTPSPHQPQQPRGRTTSTALKKLNRLLLLLFCCCNPAFVCTICGRRFGVASNLNRHTRRCAARPVNNLPAADQPAPGPSSVPSPASASAARAPTPAATPAAHKTLRPTAMARESTNPDIRRAAREQ
ncbi:hypothetical protein EW145_g8359, partial [Phellinidium pouzarii]